MNIAWIDLETTGLNHRLDEILEIALVVTDSDLNTLAEYEAVTKPVIIKPQMMNPKVRYMHEQSGLLDELQKGISLWAASWDVHDILKRYTNENNEIYLGGSGVSHFDSRFISEHMPSVDNLLSHSTMDMGVIRRFCENVVGVTSLRPQLPHRAMADIKIHIEEAVTYRDLIRAGCNS